jgi:ribosome-binding factor A
MNTRRQRKVAELLHEEISQLIQYGTQDPRIGFVTVTGVEVTPDLRLARVYVTVLGDKADAKSTLEGLNNAKGYFRRQLGQSISLRYIPELVFKLDTSLEQGMHIEHLLDSLEDTRSEDGDADSTGPEPDS